MLLIDHTMSIQSSDVDALNKKIDNLIQDGYVLLNEKIETKPMGKKYMRAKLIRRTSE